MLTGFNTNVRHRGVLFHVQTEDSGRAHPHVITHLYHGGTILASEKRGYAELLESADVLAGVRALMESQHKAMLQRLQCGECDALIHQRLGLDGFAGDTTGVPVAATAPPAACAAPAAASAPASAPAAPAAAALPVAPAAEAARPSRGFGEGVISGKPLDELVLEYLVESARKRKHSAR